MRLLILSFAAFAFLASGHSASALEDDANPFGWDQGWNVQDIELARDHTGAKSSGTRRSEVWSSGLSRDTSSALVPQSRRSVGAKLRPFEDVDLLIGTEMSRDLDPKQNLNSKTDWQIGWSRQWKDAKNLEIGVLTTGLLDNTNAAYSQSAGGSIGIRVLPDETPWNARLVVSPTVNLDTASGIWNTRLKSEIVTEKILSSRKSPIESVMNIRMGYDFERDTRPAASARFELTFSPKI